MKVGILIFTVLLLKLAGAFPRTSEMIKASDGHTYTVQVGRNGEETIYRDGEGKEVIVPMHEQGKWVMITENDDNNCYVLDMTEDEKNDNATELDFEAVDYEIVNGDETEVHPDIIKTCEENGGPGRDIILMAPKSQDVTNGLQGNDDAGIVKRAAKTCWKVYLVCIKFTYKGKPYKYCKLVLVKVPC